MRRMKGGFFATIIGLVGNIVLGTIKITVGLWTSSLSLLSDGVNSLTDVVSSIAIFIAVRVSNKDADEGHPFGHHRAEPIAGLIVAIFAGIAGFEVLKQSLIRLFTEEVIRTFGIWPFVVLIFSVLVKLAMSRYLYAVAQKINSPAILASSMESRVDILISLTALVGVAGAYQGFPSLDSMGAVVISVFIFHAGYKIGLENIDYLMGKSPDPHLLHTLRDRISRIQGVRAIDSVRAHYVGNYVHVEVEIAIDRDMSTQNSHELGERVQAELEELAAIDKAFVHINPA